MTKARTRGAAKRAQKAPQAVCAISGVRLSAEPKPASGPLRAQETAREAMETAHRNICRQMGWPFDDAHRARCRGAHMGTLYGRLMEAGRIDGDAYQGIEAWERLDNAMRREVLGSRIAPVDRITHDGEARDPDAIRAERGAAWAVLARMGSHTAQVVVSVTASAHIWPPDWRVEYDAPLNRAGHALARHFGLRP